jgi:hypothetical protein
VTTILKAFQEIERRGMSREPAVVVAPMPPERRMVRTLLFVLTPLAAIAAGVGLLWGLLASSEVPQQSLTLARVVETAPAPGAPANAAPAAVARGDDPAPWARIQGRAGAPPAAAPAQRAVAPPPAVKQRAGAAVRVERAASPSAPAQDVEPPSEPLPAARSAPAPERAAPAASSGAPRIDVRAIKFSPDSTQRRVTLSINGGPPVVMKEGESEGGVEVQLILDDVVYVRHGGSISSVSATR